MKNIVEDITWFDSLKDAEEEGFIAVKCWSLLQFFRLRGKTTILSIANLEPIPDMRYLLFSPQEGRYYLKTYRNYDVDTLFYYRRSDTFSGEDVAVEHLRRYVNDGNVTLLYTPEQVEETKAMLSRIYKANLTGGGTLTFKQYLVILKLSLSYEDYKDTGRELVGYKTVCDQYDINIRKFWNNVVLTKKQEK